MATAEAGRLLPQVGADGAHTWMEAVGVQRSDARCMLRAVPVTPTERSNIWGVKPRKDEDA